MNQNPGEPRIRAGLILAGGKSSRMGTPKALLTLAGKPLVTRVADALLTVADPVLVSLSSTMDPAPYRRILPPTVQLVLDQGKSNHPLVGILSGLSQLPPCYCAILSCDLPFASAPILAQLFQEAEGYDAAIPQWPDGRLEPLHAVYRSTETLAAARRTIQETEFSNQDLVKRLQHARLVPTDRLQPFDPPLLTFFNVNTPMDLERAERLLPTRGPATPP